MKFLLLLFTLFFTLGSEIALGVDRVIKAPTGTVKIQSGTPGMVPVGGMIAVMPNTHANSWQPPATGVIKDGFMRADGNTVPSCMGCIIPQGTVLPNMAAKYPRGGTTSGTTGGANTQASNVTIADHSHSAGTGAGALHALFKPQDGTSFVVGIDGATPTGAWIVSHQIGVNVVLDVADGPVDGPGSMGIMGSTANTALSPVNNAVNNEPAYVEVVWIIRVK